MDEPVLARYSAHSREKRGIDAGISQKFAYLTYRGTGVKIWPQPPMYTVETSSEFVEVFG
jgi:hypothetical protein